jgi:hypothetical protein
MLIARVGTLSRVNTMVINYVNHVIVLTIFHLGFIDNFISFFEILKLFF